MSIPFKKQLVRTGAIMLVSLALLQPANALSLVDSDASDSSLMLWLYEQSSYELDAAKLSAFVNARSQETLANDIEINLATLASMSDLQKDVAQMLSALDQLAAKAPIYARHSNFVMIKARMLLANKQFDTARAVIKARWDEATLATVCARHKDVYQGYWPNEQLELMLCTPRVRAWLSGDKSISVEWPTIESPALYDAHAQCVQAFPERANVIETALESSELTPEQQAKLSVRKAWPAFLASCETFPFDTSSHLSAAYGDNVLRDEYQSALASVSVERPSSVLLFGDSLPLPRSECDFDRAPDCSVTKPLSKLSAQRFAQRLNELNDNLTAESGQCVEVPKAERERREALVETLKAAVKQIMAAKPPRTDQQRLAAIDKLLDTSLSGLDFEMHSLLGAPLTKLAKTDPSGAVAVQKKLIATLGIKASETHWSQLAMLQLMAREPKSAAVSLNEALRLDYDSDIAADLALLEAIQAGARPDFFRTPIRPWTLPAGQTDLDHGDVFGVSIFQDTIYLGALPRNEVEEYRLRRDWQKVLRVAARATYIQREFYGALPKLEFSGKWQGDNFIVGSIALPWPDAFEVEGNLDKRLTEQERTKLFEAIGVTEQ